MPYPALRSLPFCLILSVLVDLVVPVSAAEKSSKPGLADEIKLERVQPMTPAESLASAEVAPGFRMELVVAEPNVYDPVAMAFDEFLRLYVVEMRDYSEKDKARLGRVRLLTDDDGDGRYETSRVFLDGLSWPTAVTCYDGGVFVGDPPNILYAKDTDGDGVADKRNVVFTGFNRTNVQGMLNSMQWGLDHRIYGSSSTTGGKISRVVDGKPDAENAVDFHNRDFAFDPKTLAISTLTGGGQHGMTFNRWGDRFVCHNSDHLQAIVFEERYLARNPYQSVVSARRSIAADGPQAEVFRISPVEGWREARTRLRVAGLASGPVEGGGRSAGYFTSGTGVTVYEGGLWPERREAVALVADVGSNLIHRKRLVPDGVTYRGERIDPNTEFVRARDIWFRPVQMAIGPEGGLYVADMYREVIEHPTSLPAVIKKQLDLSSGDDRGRIYRVVPAGYRYEKPKPLGNAGTAELVAALEDANQWRRMTALRLIYERQDSAAARLIRDRLAACDRPEGRIALLYALDSLNDLQDGDLLAALGDAHPQVRRHAIRLSEARFGQSASIRDTAIRLADDSDLVVQFQLALSLGECADESATAALADLLRRSTNRDVTGAVLTSIVDRAGGVLQSVLGDEKWSTSPAAGPVLTAIVGQIVRQRREHDLDTLVELLQPEGPRGGSGAGVLLKALSRLPADVLNGDSPQIVKLREARRAAAGSIVRAARRVLEDANAASIDREAAIEDLALDKFENQRELLEQLLSPQESAAIHAAVLAVCGQFDSPDVAPLILSHYGQFSPAERLQATEVLLRRGPWALALAEYLANEQVPLKTLDPTHVSRLQNYPSPQVKAIVRKLQGVGEDRQKIFEEYRDGGALAAGDAANGKFVFEKNCATCHEVSGAGHAVGPSLASMVNRGTESVLFNVLAPNAEVDPRFMEYVVATADGQVLSGVMAGETPTAVTILGAENKTTTILRVDVDDIQNTRRSLMPEGFEKTIDKKAMADLIEYLKQAAGSAAK